jgi:hypothetical protein
MALLKRQHVLFSLAYSLTVFVGTYLTRYVIIVGSPIAFVFQMASGLGILAYIPFYVAFRNAKEPFWAMAIPMLTGLIVTTYLICWLIERFSARQKWTGIGPVGLQTTIVVAANWLCLFAASRFIHL